MAAAAMPELGESLDPWTEDDPENFDLDGFAAEFYGDASERRMRHLRDQLSSLRDLAESEQRQNVFAHYESFIRVSREISRLQGQVGKLREMVQVPSDVVETLVADAARAAHRKARPALADPEARRDDAPSRRTYSLPERPTPPWRNLPNSVSIPAPDHATRRPSRIPGCQPPSTSPPPTRGWSR